MATIFMQFTEIYMCDFIDQKYLQVNNYLAEIIRFISAFQVFWVPAGKMVDFQSSSVRVLKKGSVQFLTFPFAFRVFDEPTNP